MKSAHLGCGPRARRHAEAYEFVHKGEIGAICDLNKERRTAFGHDFGVDSAHQYTDIREMLEKEKPDVLDIVTAPTIRVELMRIAAAYEVPVVIVEKPVAVQGEDYRQIKALSETSKTRFVVNTQLHFHRQNLELKRYVAAGRIGEVRFLDASARSTILDQGVHVLELAHTYNGCASPIRVFGQVSGAQNLAPKTGLPEGVGYQPSPDIAEAAITFENGVQTLLISGHIAPTVGDHESIYAHKRLAVYGTRGFVHWTMHGWERFTPEDGYESGSHDYGYEDVRAQAALIDAAFGWAADGEKLHPTRLELNLEQFNIILATYASALTATAIDLPFDPPDGLLDALRVHLGKAEA
ncbi:MAG: Gfo/Idh/MocA family oxidoreductase [Anaerolineae bacterium]|nr:Gfo/Idh/MocA family oxidoreductase [Anaerolineae bacterium]